MEGTPEAPNASVTPGVASPRRWRVLLAYMAVGIGTQMLWITFTPLLGCSTPTLCPSANNVALLTAIFPLVFLILSIPVGHFIDRYGFRAAVLVGSILLAVSGITRPFANSFPLLLALQGIGAIGQPFILNSISKLVRGWFPESEASVATGLGTLSIYIGLALGIGLTPAVAQGAGVQGAFELYGVLAVAACAVFALLGQERGPRAPLETSGGSVSAARGAFRVLMVPNILLLSILFFIGIGIFNAFADWVVPMMGARGVDASWAGPLGGVLILGGIIGALVMTTLADRYHQIRPLIVIALAGSSVLWAALGLLHGVLAEAVILGLLGFLFMSTLPLALDLSSKSVPPASEGMANSWVWELSQAGGFLLIFVFQDMGQAQGWTSTFFLAAGLCAGMLAISAALRPPGAPAKRENAP